MNYPDIYILQQANTDDAKPAVTIRIIGLPLEVF